MSSRSAHCERFHRIRTSPTICSLHGWGAAAMSIVELISRSICNDLGPKANERRLVRGWHSLMSAEMLSPTKDVKDACPHLSSP